MGCLKERKRTALYDPWLWCTQFQSATCKAFLRPLGAGTGKAEVSSHRIGFWCCSSVLQARDKFHRMREGDEVCSAWKLFWVSFKVPVTTTTGKSLSVCTALAHNSIFPGNWANKSLYVYIKQRRNMLRKQFHFQAWMEVLQLTERKKTNIKSRH